MLETGDLNNTLICKEVYAIAMHSSNTTNGTTVWNGTNTCPFCGSTLSDPGAGFIEHTKGSPDCRGAFEGWRDRIANDIHAEWAK